MLHYYLSEDYVRSVNIPTYLPGERPLLQVSKWVKYPVLLDSEEMLSLLSSLGTFLIGVVSQKVLQKEALMSTQAFLDVYTEYVSSLQSGRVPREEVVRAAFSTVWTVSSEALCFMKVGEFYLLKPARPVIQLQMHQFFYSEVDGAFHPMSLGPTSITWGIQFSYPQWFQDPKTGQISRVGNGEENTALFASLVRWLRSHTLPTPFCVNGKRINSPIRLGKNCLSWVNRHPQLAPNIQVHLQGPI